MVESMLKGAHFLKSIHTSSLKKIQYSETKNHIF